MSNNNALKQCIKTNDMIVGVLGLLVIICVLIISTYTKKENLIVASSLIFLELIGIFLILIGIL